MRIKKCAGYPGFSVSDSGEVFKNDEPAMAYYNNGYVKVSLRNEKNYYKSESVHRLVVRAFKGEIPKGLVIDHINGIKDDNRLENLEVVTIKENNRRRFLLQGNPMKLSEYVRLKNERNKSLQLDSE